VTDAGNTLVGQTSLRYRRVLAKKAICSAAYKFSNIKDNAGNLRLIPTAR